MEDNKNPLIITLTVAVVVSLLVSIGVLAIALTQNSSLQQQGQMMAGLSAQIEDLKTQSAGAGTTVANEASSPMEAVVVSNGYKSLSNLEGGYKIECPRSWNLFVSQSNRRNSLFGPNATVDSGLGGVEVVDFIGTTEDYLNYLKANVEISIASQKKVVVANNISAIELTRANKKGYSVIFSVNGNAYNIYLNSGDAVNKEYLDIIVGSFSFIK